MSNRTLIHDRASGRKPLPDRMPNEEGGQFRCSWHTTGKPLWWAGPFFQEGCPQCEAKASTNPGLRTAPRPDQAFEIYKERKRAAGRRRLAAMRAVEGT